MVLFLALSVSAQAALNVKATTNSDDVTNVTITFTTDPSYAYTVTRYAADQKSEALAVCTGVTASPCTDHAVTDGVHTWGVVAKKNNTAGTEEFSNSLEIKAPTTPINSGKTVLGTDIAGHSALSDFVGKIVDWVVYRIGPGIVGLMILYAAFKYISSQGNEASITEAKELLMGTIIGYILLFLIGAIMRVLLPI